MHDLFLNGVPKQCIEAREALIKALHSDISPVKGYSAEFMYEVDDFIRNADFRTYLDLDEYSFSSFVSKVLDSPDLQRIKELEKDFINNFKMEQLISKNM